MGRKKNQSVPDIIDTINDPQAFLLSLIGAEALAKREEDGPLARPWRSIPTTRRWSPRRVYLEDNAAQGKSPDTDTDTDTDTDI